MANAIIAALLSFLVPGLGQAYAGEIKRGIIFIIIGIILVIITYNLISYASIVSLMFGIYAAYDACILSQPTKIVNSTAHQT